MKCLTCDRATRHRVNDLPICFFCWHSADEAIQKEVKRILDEKKRKGIHKNA